MRDLGSVIVIVILISIIASFTNWSSNNNLTGITGGDIIGAPYRDRGITYHYTCSEDDKGEVYTHSGTTTVTKWQDTPTLKVVRTVTKNDNCESSTKLREWHCLRDGTSRGDAYTCPYGCEEGACKPKPPVCGDGTKHWSEECDDGNLNDKDGCTSTCKSASDRCTDSDSSETYQGMVRGTTKEIADDGKVIIEKKDSCSNDGTVLTEYTCDGDTIKETEYNCYYTIFGTDPMSGAYTSTIDPQCTTLGVCSKRQYLSELEER
ncbi:DUF4215 domain-containing protein [Candidatus Woesearchaeota archaeon]|nr:DUF4215 domain-containing protein [Candidatus Woesearchaeota archaeon]